MAYQSLYRRYRSQKFGELVGQRHVVAALKNAIADDRVGHAYLFSGPRGTGKTSTARILAKALNCTDLGADGEPCCQCESCIAFEAGTSYDLQELDAASNNGVEAIRDLISKVALGSPGRTKVYILDEVHMLTAGAENALLKTLEEPPDHVVFVLATTEPHKVVPTIRSRTQHFEFELIPAAELEAHVRWVADDAGLDVDDAMIDHVLRVGGGSARDTLSALDQVVAAGGVPRDDDGVAQILEGLAASDAGAVVAGVNAALTAGRDPRVIGERLLGVLRNAFLHSMGAPAEHLSDAQAAAAADVAAQMGPAAITRSLELIGTSLIEMRQAPDPRVDLEVVLLRLTRPDLSTDAEALLARVERLERGGQAPGGPATLPSGAPAPASSQPQTTPPGDSTRSSQDRPPRRPADGARAALAAQRSDSRSGADAGPANGSSQASAPDPPVPSRSATTHQATLGAHRRSAPTEPGSSSTADPGTSTGEPTSPPPPDREGSVTLAAVHAVWDDIRASLPGRAKSRFSGGRFVSGGDGVLVFGLPNQIHRDRCQDCVGDVEAALSSHFGAPVRLELIVDGDAVAPSPRADESAATAAVSADDDADEAIDLTELVDADADAAGGIDLLTEAFPGAEFVEGTDADQA